MNVTFVFARNSLTKPIAILPVQQKPTVCVRCHPLRFEKKNSNVDSILKLPYRLIWAVATLDYVLIYDSEEMMPIACIEDINCAELTDLSW
jgi:chromatin assembly factor 1 subunit B